MDIELGVLGGRVRVELGVDNQHLRSPEMITKRCRDGSAKIETRQSSYREQANEVEADKGIEAFEKARDADGERRAVID